MPSPRVLDPSGLLSPRILDPVGFYHAESWTPVGLREVGFQLFGLGTLSPLLELKMQTWRSLGGPLFTLQDALILSLFRLSASPQDARWSKLLAFLIYAIITSIALGHLNKCPQLGLYKNCCEPQGGMQRGFSPPFRRLALRLGSHMSSLAGPLSLYVMVNPGCQLD